MVHSALPDPYEEEEHLLEPYWILFDSTLEASFTVPDLSGGTI